MEKYPKISPKLCIETIKYNDLENFFSQIPKSFIKRLVHLNSLIVDTVKDPEQLKQFLINFKTLNFLKLKNIGLDQDFYSNDLVDCVPYVKILTIEDKNCTDFNFLLRLSNPNKFRIDQNLKNLDIVADCMKRFKDHYFSQFKFFYSNKKCKVTKTVKGDYKLMKGRKFSYNKNVVELMLELQKDVKVSLIENFENLRVDSNSDSKF